MKQQEIPLTHLFLYLKIKKKVRGNIIETSEIHKILTMSLKFLSIPKRYNLHILKEMEDFNLLKRVNIQKYEILSNHCEKLKKLEESLPFL